MRFNYIYIAYIGYYRIIYSNVEPILDISLELNQTITCGRI